MISKWVRNVSFWLQMTRVLNSQQQILSQISCGVALSCTYEFQGLGQWAEPKWQNSISGDDPQLNGHCHLSSFCFAKRMAISNLKCFWDINQSQKRNWLWQLAAGRSLSPGQLQHNIGLVWWTPIVSSLLHSNSRAFWGLSFLKNGSDEVASGACAKHHQNCHFKLCHGLLDCLCAHHLRHCWSLWIWCH